MSRTAWLGASVSLVPSPPMIASTAASRGRDTPATTVNVPPRYRVLPPSASVATLALGWGWKPGLAAPVDGSSAASRSQGAASDPVEDPADVQAAAVDVLE